MAEPETPDSGPASEPGSETKKIVSPRVEIDTSPPFGSVKEAVTRFGGSGSWIPLHLLRLAAHHGLGEYDLDKVEEQAAELEKDLLVRERETLGILKELEATKRFVEGVKLKLVKDVSECISSPELTSLRSLNPCPSPSPGLILMELNQAKLNLNKSTNDLAAIRASVSSLNNKMKKEKVSPEKPLERQITKPGVSLSSIEEKLNQARLKILPSNTESRCDSVNPTNITGQLQQLNFEAEQFKNIAEAAKYEVMKAMAEIEQTKTSINMVEMRLVAARKMEEAARAVEAVAFAEMKARSNHECSSGPAHLRKPGGITLSFEEYSSLAQKARKAEEMSKRRAREFVRHIDEAPGEVQHVKMPEEGRRRPFSEEAFFGGRVEEIRHSEHNSMFKFKDSYPSYGHQADSELPEGNEPDSVKEKTVPVLRSTISIGDILSRKLILQDDFMVGDHVESHTERQQVSLSQMLREQSGLILQPKKSTAKDGVVHKHFFTHRKKFGFIDISLPLTRQNKKKSQALNMR